MKLGSITKKALLSASALVAMSSASPAADVPFSDGLAKSSQASSWTGFYAGLNFGYGVGTSGSVQNNSSIINDNWANWASYNSASSTGCGGNACNSFTNPSYGIVALASSGIAAVTQNGVVGGGQFGLNKLIADKFIVGLEADFQGSGMRGSGSYTNASADNFSKTKSNAKPYSSYSSRSFIGDGNSKASMNWIGTVRPRAGILIKPDLLLFGTGGLAYGNVSLASHYTVISQIATTENNNGSISTINQTSIATSSGYRTSSLAGWSAGGGFEWLIAPSWSVKSEAIYYSLGSLSTVSSPLILASTDGILSSNLVNTQASYQGIIARVGLNYHFTW